MIENLITRTLTGQGDSDQHTLTLFSLALNIKAKNILELGVRDGGTTEPLLLAVSILGGHLDSVDINDCNVSFTSDLKNFWTFHKEDAIKFLKNNTKKYDLIYLDDWHSYEHVKTELELISHFADKNTVILLHDLMGNGSHPNYATNIPGGTLYPQYNTQGSEWYGGGPYRAVSELNLDVWEWATIPVNHGLTLLRKK
jgi:predicted O-methyltransferase YrrM